MLRWKREAVAQQRCQGGPCWLRPWGLRWARGRSVPRGPGRGPFLCGLLRWGARGTLGLFGSSAGLIGIRPTTIWDEPGWCSAPIREKEKLNLNQKGWSAIVRDAERLDGRFVWGAGLTFEDWAGQSSCGCWNQVLPASCKYMNYFLCSFLGLIMINEWLLTL